MEDKTKKKRVQKRAVRKKTKATESVSIPAPAAETLTAPTMPSTPPAPATETKKQRKTSKAKSVSSTNSVSNAKSGSSAKSKAKTPKVAAHLPTFEQVQLRAYFISERRRKLGLPGDDSHDWLTAERELREELSV
jgi:hypothetical protein